MTLDSELIGVVLTERGFMRSKDLYGRSYDLLTAISDWDFSFYSGFSSYMGNSVSAARSFIFKGISCGIKNYTDISLIRFLLD